jgi:RNA polymerase sigma factor for flagellar operon FliA
MTLDTMAHPAGTAYPAGMLAAGALDAASFDRARGSRDPEAREALVRRYGHLIKYAVGRLGVSIPGVFDHEDAMQAGAVGLLQAIDGYRHGSAASFESYALMRIRGAILDAIRALDIVGRTGRETARAIERAMRELHAELGRPPDEAEVAGRLGVTVQRYHERLQASSCVTVSLDELDPRTSEDEPGGLSETLADLSAVDPMAEVEHRDDVARLAKAIGQLPERQRMVLSLYYQDGMTLKEIGQVLGVTESRVCQIHAESVLVLRSRLLGPDEASRAGARKGMRP